ncbi:ribonuclease HII [Bifidobacterium gallicum]|uniref:Ribonuclease n=1 Tax=Bifidobacterium gallicum DSM 20093 = LMG 11596 TaxID=561180 RepID=D1NUB6_9BIFI|nr:ribonuclease HII [Bifidobacterium gallicum]EFA23320.1 ribonuclease HII [Bifidobacterium gallicum DSM 20093 = LMG 11596]KFI58312.1 ribonuclease HII [Bifidobacterium gallicum DSM 20093 = LMG 11596]
MPSVIPTLDREQELADQGFDLIVGFDEVGRGALAGPVMVGAAAIWAADLPQLHVPDHVADSKMLTERRREAIYEDLEAWSAAWAVGQASNQEIDDWGISHALGIAALRALAQLEHHLGIGIASNQTSISSEATTTLRTPRIGAILDGPHDYITKALGTFEAPDVPINAHVVTQVKGDQHCATVASAAVIAKVTRDHLMIELAERPEYAPYGWASNKGYGAKAHRQAIVDHGLCDLHRLSWKLT